MFHDIIFAGVKLLKAVRSIQLDIQDDASSCFVILPEEVQVGAS